MHVEEVTQVRVQQDLVFAATTLSPLAQEAQPSPKTTLTLETRATQARLPQQALTRIDCARSTQMSASSDLTLKA